MRHKFHAKPTTHDGIRFSSKLEGEYYKKLKLCEKSGQLLFFLQQVPFRLPGGVKYIVDFVEFWDDGEIKFTEVKGLPTPLWIAKHKMVESLYPVKINIVTTKDMRH